MVADPKVKRWRSDKYKDMIRSKDCFMCGKAGPGDPHHVRFAEDCGGLVPSDYLCIPTCRECHTAIHDFGSRFRKMDIGREELLMEVVKNMGEWIRGMK